MTAMSDDDLLEQVKARLAEEPDGFKAKLERLLGPSDEVMGLDLITLVKAQGRGAVVTLLTNALEQSGMYPTLAALAADRAWNVRRMPLVGFKSVNILGKILREHGLTFESKAAQAYLAHKAQS